jgi:ornithine decarboxylase
VLQTPGGWDFPVWTSRPDHAEVPQVAFTITGPTCDSTDTIAYGVPLPVTMAVGDVLYLGSTGAYTLAYASAFNGFPPPTPVYVGSAASGCPAGSTAGRSDRASTRG